MGASILRITETYGPGDYRLLKLFKAIARGRFLVIGDGDNYHHLTYIEDLCEIISRVIQRGCQDGAVFVTCSNRAHTTLDMVHAVADTMGCRRTTLRVPLAPLSLLATVLGSMLKPIGIQPPIHHRRLDFFRKSYRFSSEQLAELMGAFRFTPLEVGLERTRDWYAREGLL